MSLLSTPLGRFRLVSVLEGISYLGLLAVAMPLKYLAGQPAVVTVVGGIHGALFVLFAVALTAAAMKLRWSVRASGLAMLAAVLPLGAFVLERALRHGTFAAPSDLR
jgi:integral membrane protein